ncbi:CinA family protein [Klebsiella pneumoniae subsp. pneumoniae]|nr:CinA family protein [Klebsiella pneumoniae subsp. pneumoniae]
MKPSATCCRFARKPLAVHSAVSEACVQEMSFWYSGARRGRYRHRRQRLRRTGGRGRWYPAGTVWFAWNFRGQTETKRMCFAGDCETVVAKAVRYAPAALSEKLAHWQ